MDMETAELGAAMQLWKDLARVEQAIRIESAFEALLVRQVALVEHCSHEVALFHADPVLTRQHPTDLDAKSQDIGSKSLGSFNLVNLIGVVKYQRMKIPIAGMENVGNRESVPV